jgi:hypothetical protein
MLGSSWVAAQLVASQEGLSSMSDDISIHVFYVKWAYSRVLIIYVVFRSVIRWSGFYCMIMAGTCSYVCVYDKCFTTLYEGAFFQLIIGLLGVFGLCNFSWRGGLGVLHSSLYISIWFLFVRVCCYIILVFFFGSVGLLIIVNLLFCMKLFTLYSFSSCIRMTVVFPLSVWKEQ